MPSFTANSLGVSANQHYTVQGSRAVMEEGRNAGWNFRLSSAFLLYARQLRRRIRDPVPAVGSQRIMEPRGQPDAVAGGEIPLDVRGTPHTGNRRADGRVLEDEA